MESVDSQNPGDSNNSAWQALNTFMSHSSSCDIQVLCKLLQTSHQCRALLSKSPGVSITIPSWHRNGFRIFSTKWLPRYGFLVRHLSIQTQYCSPYDREDNFSIAAAARLLSTGLEQAATKAPASMPLQLHSYNSSVINTVQTLAALPAASLTRLELTCPNSINKNSREWCNQLMQLSRLQQLRLRLTTHNDDTEKLLALLTTQVEAALKHMSQLRHLDLSWFVPDLRLLQGLKKLPDNLNCLKLDITISEFAFEISNLQPLDLQHLTALRQLQLCLSGTMKACPWQIMPLPGQLTNLELCFRDSRQSVNGLGILAMQQLQQLSFNFLCGSAELQQLSTLTSLTDLSLEHYSHAEAAGAARVWAQLSQLHSLTMDLRNGYIEQLTVPLEDREVRLEQMIQGRASIMQGIHLATSLTKLDLWLWGFTGESVALCNTLKPLKGLQWLRLRVGCPDSSWVSPALLSSEDAIHLTALTAMSHLDLAAAERGVGDSVALQLCQAMPLLRHLNVSCCNLFAVATLQAMAELKQLTFLNIAGNRSRASDSEVAQIFAKKKSASLKVVGMGTARRLCAFSSDAIGL